MLVLFDIHKNDYNDCEDCEDCKDCERFSGLVAMQEAESPEVAESLVRDYFAALGGDELIIVRVGKLEDVICGTAGEHSQLGKPITLDYLRELVTNLGRHSIESFCRLKALDIIHEKIRLFRCTTHPNSVLYNPAVPNVNDLTPEQRAEGLQVLEDARAYLNRG